MRNVSVAILAERLQLLLLLCVSGKCSRTSTPRKSARLTREVLDAESGYPVAIMVRANGPDIRDLRCDVWQLTAIHFCARFAVRTRNAKLTWERLVVTFAGIEDGAVDGNIPREAKPESHKQEI